MHAGSNRYYGKEESCKEESGKESKEGHKETREKAPISDKKAPRYYIGGIFVYLFRHGILVLSYIL